MNDEPNLPAVRSYDAFDWYWRHGDGRIFASGRRTIVGSGDQGFVDWCERGNTPTPWPVDEEGAQTDAALQQVLDPYGLRLPGAVPRSVTRAQAKIALHRAGMLDFVQIAIGEDPELEIWFNEASQWERDNPHIVTIGEKLIGGSEGVDQLFVEAARITA